MPIGAMYGVISPGSLSSTDVRSYKIHYVVTGHFLCQRFKNDTVGELREGTEPVSVDRFQPFTMRFGEDEHLVVLEEFRYWLPDD